jgi:large subunit ribosomal protein L31
MKNDIHPLYHPVVFKDLSNGQLIVTRSTMTSEQKIRLSDGNEYPVVARSRSRTCRTRSSRASSASWTRRGRVDKFKKRYGR